MTMFCGACGKPFEDEDHYEKHVLKIGSTRWCVYKMKERVDNLLRELEERDVHVLEE